VSLPLHVALPEVFLALPLLLLLMGWARRSLDPLTPRRRRLSLGLRMVLAVVLLLALADLRWLGSADRHALVFLVDTSASVGEAARERARAFAENLPADADAVVWTAFAGRARTIPREPARPEAPATPATGESSPPPDPDEPGLDPAATDLPNALAFARASVPAGHVPTFVLLSDGNFTRGGPAEAGASLARQGVRLHTVAVAPPERGEILVRNLRAPRRVREGEPFVLEAEIVSQFERPATLTLYRNGVVAGKREFTMPTGTRTVSFNQLVEDVRVGRFAVEVEAAGDALLDNNRLGALVVSEGKARALLLTDQPAQARYLALALRQEDIRLDVRPAAGAPGTLADAQNYDVVVIDNVPATELSTAQMQVLARYVRDFGGGLLMLGGDNAFGLGGYYETAIDEVLPLKSGFEREEQTPSLGMALIIDKSGSMGGAKIEMAKKAARAAVSLLSAQDFAGVVAFDGSPGWAAEMQQVVNRAGLSTLISRIRAGGGTNLAPAMELAYRQLERTPAKIKHVLILSDGQSQPGDFVGLARRMADAGMTISTVALGEGAHAALLRQLATIGGGRFYATRNAASIPRIFAKETVTASKSAVREQPFLPVRVQPAPFLTGVDLESAPFLTGYVLTEAKPTAEVWLATEQGSPLLATCRYGLGNAGAFTSDARARWATEWLRWPGFGPFWAQVLRQLSREPEMQEYPAVAERHPGGEGYTVTVDLTDSQGGYPEGATGRMIVAGPDGTRREEPLLLNAPGLLEGSFPAREPGDYHAEVLIEDAGGQALGRRYLALSRGYSPEYRLAPPDREALTALAEATGGRLNPSQQELVNPADPRRALDEKPLWPLFAALALAIFLTDVTFKRLPCRGT